MDVGVERVLRGLWLALALPPMRRASTPGRLMTCSIDSAPWHFPVHPFIPCRLPSRLVFVLFARPSSRVPYQSLDTQPAPAAYLISFLFLLLRLHRFRTRLLGRVLVTPTVVITYPELFPIGH